MKVLKLSLAALLAAAYCAATAQAAFIVEAIAPGKATANFSSLGHSTSIPSTALGTTSPNSAFGNPANSTGPDQYTFRYTPGTDVDNTPYTLGDVLGNSSAVDADGAGPLAPVYANVPQLATGAVGGGTGLYRVYFTTPASTNVNVAGSRIEITNDLATVTLNPVNLNNGGTGPNTNPNPLGAYIGGANNAWLHVATVPLTAGNIYTLTITANAPTFVSQRAHGVMWEYVGPIIPEPSSFVLAGLALVGMAVAVRRQLLS